MNPEKPINTGIVRLIEVPAVGLEPTRVLPGQMKKPINTGKTGPAAGPVHVPLVPWGHHLTERKYCDT